MAYGDKFAGYARSNRRKDKRRAVACRLVAASGRTLGVTKDLSMGGLAVAGAVPGIPCGSAFPVQLEIPGGKWIALPARVVRNGGARNAADNDFAVQFNALSPQAFAALERIMVAPMRAQA